MQPYFFPYVGYFALINQVDLFVLLDTVQFMRHSWIERNQMLKATGKPLYIKAPLVKHRRTTTIDDIFIRNEEPWKNKILAQLTPYKKKAPNYYKVVGLLREIFELDTNSIVELNQYALLKVCQYLHINTPIKIWSEMNIEIDSVNAPDEWALNISKALGADMYINTDAGRELFNHEKYQSAGIDLKFIEVKPIPYKQLLSEEFVPNLSILDILMFCDLEETHRMLDNYKLTDKW